MSSVAAESVREDTIPRPTAGPRLRGAFPFTPADWLALGAAFVFGLAARVWVLRGELGTLDSDEAVVGLIARRMLDGDPAVFFWGQTYGGTLEAGAAAVVFAIFGPGVLSLKIVSVVLAFAAVGLTYALGCRVLDGRRAAYAAAALWMANGNYVWWSTKSRGFYWSTICLGLLVLLCAHRVGQDTVRRGWWIALGSAAGLGWWSSPQILHFLVPAALWLLAHQRRNLGVLLRGCLWAAPAAIIGAAPWIISNVRTGFASFEYGQEVPGTAFDRFQLFFTRGLPVMFGLNASEEWLLSPASRILYAALLVLMAWSAFRAWKQPKMRLVVVYVFTYPLIFTIFPTGWAIGEGRYLIFLLAPLLLMFVVAVPPGPFARAMLVLVAIITVVDLRQIEHRSRPLAVDVIAPADIAPLVTLLDERNITRGWADYWVAYRVTFETDERIVLAPDQPQKTRNHQLTDVVNLAPGPTRIGLMTSASAIILDQSYPTVSSCVDRLTAAPFVVYQPRPDGTPECRKAAVSLLSPYED